MSMNRHVILNYVDTPLRLLLWTIPEIVMLVGPCLLGLAVDQFTLGVAASVVYWWSYKKYKKKFGKGQFQAVKYWYFPHEDHLKAIPPSYIREYLG